jgi:hypothetical protein
VLLARILHFGTESDNIQAGFVSSHFFFRLLHVIQPVLLRPLGCFILDIEDAFGCFLGRPRGLLVTVTPDVPGVFVPRPSLLSSWLVSAFASINSSSSSISSTLGTTSSLEGEGGDPLFM